MKLTTDELADVCMPELSETTLGQLTGLRRAYESMAATRREGKELPEQPRPYSLFDAKVWDRCAQLVGFEIKTFPVSTEAA